MRVLLTLSVFLLIGCGIQTPKDSLNFFPISESDFHQFMNDKAMPEQVDLAKEKHIINNDYPIELSIYKDGNWYYNLENLGDGKGSWEFKNGKIELKAERPLFDMHITIEATSENAETVVFRFFDRHGFNTIETEKVNF